MHLLITCAEDKTADLLCERLQGTVLRLNLERWQEYTIELHPTGFSIADRFGRRVDEHSVRNIILRKPLKDVPRDDGEIWYGFHQFRTSVRSIVSDFRRCHPERLPIDPLGDQLVDKFFQLRAADRHFLVPPWRFTTAPSCHPWGHGDWVTKGIAQVPIPGTGTPAKVLYTTQVQPAQLADGWPWLIQRREPAPVDLTILYVGGRQFGFVLDRHLFDGVDWRVHLYEPSIQAAWQHIALPAAVTTKVDNFMGDVGLRFGRLDLLADPEHLANPTFLEVNPNGQWAWLDPGRTSGLFDAVLAFLTSPSMSG
jgi:hypothetical protein